MAKVIILGSANSIADEQHENAHLAIQGSQDFILVDCAGNPIVRLKQAGLNFERLSSLILTHFHPDHVSGVPLLLMNMWLLGRQRPLKIYGLEHTVTRTEALMEAFGWSQWPGFFPVTFHTVPAEKMTLVLENDEFRVFSSPVEHLIPTIGLRVENLLAGTALAYSCDTQPCAAVEELSANAAVFLHEATGQAPGHSSAFQAGEVAQRAGAQSLYLIHYNVRDPDLQQLVLEAQQAYSKRVALVEDFMEILF